MVGKQIRLERIMNRDTGRTVIVPMDHGVTVGPIDGLIDMKTTVNAVATGGANAIVIHKGIVTSGHRRRGKDVGLVIHLSGSTSLSPYPNAKTLICTVEEALKLERTPSPSTSMSVMKPTGDAGRPGHGGSPGPGMGHTAAGHDVPPGRKDQKRD